MRLALLNDKLIGRELVMPIYSSEGAIILNKGYVLSSQIISRLKNMGIGTVYVNDTNYEDVVIQELLESSLKLKIIKTLKQEFESVKNSNTLKPEVIKDIVKDILENMASSENSIISFDNLGDRKFDIYYHSLNVTVLSILLGISSGYNYSQLYDLAVGALLHDVGRLFSDEKSHPEEGLNLLRKYREFSLSSNICAYAHHEHIDGTGYPRGIKSPQIYDYAKIVSICNEYDRLLHSDKNLLPHEVLERISASVGSKFEENFYKDFIKVIYCYPNGLTVRLNNNQSGVVIKQNKSFPQRPVIKVIDGINVRYLNLMEELKLFIEEVSF